MKTPNLFSSVQSLLCLALAAATFVGTSGCTSVLVVPEVKGEYKLGELQVLLDRDFATVHGAAKQALKDLGLFETRDDRKLTEAELNGRDAGDTKVTVKVEEAGKNLTRLRIRYGFKGDLAASQKFFQAVQKRL
jgi:hypothetical protein